MDIFGHINMHHLRIEPTNKSNGAYIEVYKDSIIVTPDGLHSKPIILNKSVVRKMNELWNKLH